jgi:hypothetical protein
LNDDPSTVMLFMRLSSPAKLLPLDCGVRRVTSLRRPDNVGSSWISSRRTVVAAPVCAELKTGSVCAVTVTVSCTAMARTVIGTSVATPRFTVTSVCVNGSNAAPPVPVNATVTVYGPPTRMLRIEKRPSARVVASYVLPDGS